MTNFEKPRAVLNWHLAMGADETIAEFPLDRFEPSGSQFQQNLPVTDARPRDQGTEANVGMSANISGDDIKVEKPSLLTPSVLDLVASANNLKDLETAIINFEGCSLKKTATNLVFFDGSPDGRVFLIGEAPGAEEDRKGKPFVGPSGQLLDKMLASIGLDRNKVLISNTVFWRPPGNRTPTPLEVSSCLPFIERVIELTKPKIIIPLGGPAAKSLLKQNAGIGKLRGRWFEYSSQKMDHTIPATPLFHPAYLLRTPAQKRAAWRDLIMIKRHLDNATDVRKIN